MERITVTEMARNLSDVLSRVAYHGARFELARGRKVIARLLPAEAPSAVKVGDLHELFAGAPALGDEASAFKRDLAEIRRRAAAPPNRWK